MADTFTTIIIQHEDTQAQFDQRVPLNRGRHNFANAVARYFETLAGGVFADGNVITVNDGATQASGSLTLIGQPAAAQYFVLNGVRFTAETSGAVGNQFNIGGTVAQTCANIATAIDGYSAVDIGFTATAVGQVVNIVANMPGAAGNVTLQAAMNNTTASGTTLTGGLDGTQYVFKFGHN